MKVLAKFIGYDKPEWTPADNVIDRDPDDPMALFTLETGDVAFTHPGADLEDDSATRRVRCMDQLYDLALVCQEAVSSRRRHNRSTYKIFSRMHADVFKENFVPHLRLLPDQRSRPRGLDPLVKVYTVDRLQQLDEVFMRAKPPQLSQNSWKKFWRLAYVKNGAAVATIAQRTLIIFHIPGEVRKFSLPKESEENRFIVQDVPFEGPSQLHMHFVVELRSKPWYLKYGVED